MSGTIWGVKFECSGLGGPVSYWIKTPKAEIALAKARRLLEKERTNSGFSKREIRDYKLSSVVREGEIDG